MQCEVCVYAPSVYTRIQEHVYTTHTCVYAPLHWFSACLQPGYLNQVTQVVVGSNGLLPLLHYLATVVNAFSQRLLGLVVEGYFFWIIFAVEAIRVDLHLVF